MVYPVQNIKYKYIVNQSLKNVNSKIIKNNINTALKVWVWKKLAKELNEILRSINFI